MKILLYLLLLAMSINCVSHQLTSKASLPSKSVSDYLEKKAISKTYDDDDFTLARSSIIELTEKNKTLQESLTACLANKVNNENNVGLSMTIKQVMSHLIILAVLGIIILIIFYVRKKVK